MGVIAKTRNARQETRVECRVLSAEHRAVMRAVASKYTKRYRGLLDRDDIESAIALRYVELLQSPVPDREGSFESYLWKALSGAVVDAAGVEVRERFKRERVKLLDVTESDYAMVEPDGPSEALRALEGLPERMRTVLRRRLLDGARLGEVAFELAISVASVRRIQADGIARLRGRLLRRCALP